MPTKLIEVALPLDVINKEAAREKSIRHGHPSTLHLWWARRPLAACRAVLFAQLVDDPSAHPDRFPTAEAQDAERQRLFRIIERLVPWDASGNEAILEEARAEIRKCYPDGAPPIVDPFCGGGSIPLEAQRLGLEVRASDLNPVAVLITKALVELPPKFAGRPPVHPDDSGRFATSGGVWKGSTGLADDIRWYGNWMRDRAAERIGRLYPTATPPGGSPTTVIAWVWARTVACPNPACGSVMPLARSFWLNSKKGSEAWINPVVERDNKRVRFEIGHGKSGPPIDGTVKRGGAICLVCESPVPLDHIRREGRRGHLDSELMAIVTEGSRQRLYLPPDELHAQAARMPRPVDLPETELSGKAAVNVPLYGIARHVDLFTNRQLTALCTLSDLVTEARDLAIADSGNDMEYANAIAAYLGFGVDKAALTNTTLATWQSNPSRLSQAFARQAVPMTWDYVEANPLSRAGGGFVLTGVAIAEVLERLSPGVAAAVCQEDARSADYAGAVVATDPPYYDNISYADISDYLYIWLRRSLRNVYPGLLGTLLTPKEDELVADRYRFSGDKQAADRYFEDGLRAIFTQMSTHANGDAPVVVFYAYRQEESAEGSPDEATISSSTGWEKMLTGLLGSGFAITGTWPMRTELVGNLKGTVNALASSIVLVCRPRPTTAGVTDRRGFQQALRSRLAGALRNLQSGGIAPVDLAQAAIGPGMAVFSGYAKVVEPNGGTMSVRTALGLINQVLDEVTAEQEGEFDEDTRWAVAWYAEHGMDDGPFGRADDLSRAKNVSVEGLVRAGIVKSGAGRVRLLDRSELDPDWNPALDARLTIWEVTQHLIRRLLDESEASAADLLARVGGLGEPARDLAYRLFQIAESKKWAKEAGPYNALAASWPELSRRAALGQNVQETLIVSEE